MHLGSCSSFYYLLDFAHFFATRRYYLMICFYMHFLGCI